MLTVRLLDLTHGNHAYEAFVESRFKSCLRGKDPYGIDNTLIIAIGAEKDGKPVGLLLISYYKSLRRAQTHSVFVVDVERHHTIATQMLQKAQEILTQHKAITLSMGYSTGDSNSVYLEKIFTDLKWEAPVITGIECEFDTLKFHPEWFERQYPLASSFEIFSWKQLTSQERSALKDQEVKHLFPPSVSPFQNERTIEHSNSLGLRYKGEVIGWMVCHRKSPDCVEYSALYVQRKFKNQGQIIALLCESIRLQQRADIPQSRLQLNLTQSSSSWASFIKRRLVPYASKVTYQKNAWKDL